MKNITIRKLAYTSMFIALGFVLPFVAAYVPRLGKMLLPMHIPVLLCGVICGGKYGMLCGAVLPFFRSLTLGSPKIYPDAFVMTFELLTYGLAIGLLYSHIRLKNPMKIYICLIASMLLGRLVWAVARTLAWGLGTADFSFEIFIASGFVNALPGIILQLLIVPTVVLVYERSHIKSGSSFDR